MVPPAKDATTRDEVLWSEWIESIRKDVECFFGVCKARFRFLRNPVEYGLSTVDCAFRTSCILHNMLLAYDGYDGADMSREEFWNALDPDLSDFNQLQNPEMMPYVECLKSLETFSNVIDMHHLH